MEEKLKALKTLGFNYITRSMNGMLMAWDKEPTRYITCQFNKRKDARRKYGEKARIDPYGYKDYKEVDGYFTDFCVFVGIDDIKYRSFELYDSNNEFKGITWENSPFEIP